MTESPVTWGFAPSGASKIPGMSPHRPSRPRFDQIEDPKHGRRLARPTPRQVQGLTRRREAVRRWSFGSPVDARKPGLQREGLLFDSIVQPKLDRRELLVFAKGADAGRGLESPSE